MPPETPTPTPAPAAPSPAELEALKKQVETLTSQLKVVSDSSASIKAQHDALLTATKRAFSADSSEEDLIQGQRQMLASIGWKPSDIDKYIAEITAPDDDPEPNDDPEPEPRPRNKQEPTPRRSTVPPLEDEDVGGLKQQLTALQKQVEALTGHISQRQHQETRDSLAAKIRTSATRAVDTTPALVTMKKALIEAQVERGVDVQVATQKVTARLVTEVEGALKADLTSKYQSSGGHFSDEWIDPASKGAAERAVASLNEYLPDPARLGRPQDPGFSEAEINDALGVELKSLPKTLENIKPGEQPEDFGARARDYMTRELIQAASETVAQGAPNRI